MLNSVLREIVAKASVESKQHTDAQPYCSRGEFDDVTIAGDAWKGPVKKHFEQNKAMASNGLIRPRSALARAFIEKQQNDRTLQEFDKNEWYRVDKSRLSPEMQSTFVQLHADEETKSFLSNSIEKSSWVWTQIWYLLAKAVLKHFWSITDINGWLGRGSMFVLSEAQARSMLRAARRCADGSGSLVDVGAGDGEVSRRFAHLYGEKYATEISASMRKTLLSKGYTLLDVDDWWRTKQFDCVCMLNLLDRCSRPRSMLRDARAALAPGGLLLLALVLPYKPYVEGERHSALRPAAHSGRAPCCGTRAPRSRPAGCCCWRSCCPTSPTSKRPRSMLRDARAALAPGGLLLLALVLPYKPYVEGERHSALRPAAHSGRAPCCGTRAPRSRPAGCCCWRSCCPTSPTSKRPRSMLRDARAALAPGGLLLLALVLPYKPYVEGERHSALRPAAHSGRAPCCGTRAPRSRPAGCCCWRSCCPTSPTSKRPRSMLRDARAALAPGGLLLLALVLPYKPYVEGERHSALRPAAHSGRAPCCGTRAPRSRPAGCCCWRSCCPTSPTSKRPRSMLRDARAALAPGGLLLLALVLPYKPYVEGERHSALRPAAHSGRAPCCGTRLLLLALVLPYNGRAPCCGTLAPGGLLLLALVLPYKPYVEVTADHKPEERLGVTGAGFEEQATALVEQMRSAGWALRAWARAPYLCEGDFAQAYYWLDDSVYVFQPAPIEPGN
ncbi:uncharacterized protein LOC135077251 [Ostrinia nubilalis]|uniref:uncharacterized protein LOC135077251 n=1 Tax=Ostrinia nubilalis TaxID=29057 RepID=UPI0030824FE3